MKLRFKYSDPDREATLVCLVCGRELRLPETSVGPALARLAERTAHRTLYAVVSLFGTCESCRRKEEHR